MSVSVNIHVNLKQLVIGKLPNHNLVWSHVNNTRAIANKAVDFQSMRSEK